MLDRLQPGEHRVSLLHDIVDIEGYSTHSVQPASKRGLMWKDVPRQPDGALAGDGVHSAISRAAARLGKRRGGRGRRETSGAYGAPNGT